MRSVQGMANNLVLAVMKHALEMEKRGNLTIERDAEGHHIRYEMTEKGRKEAADTLGRLLAEEQS